MLNYYTITECVCKYTSDSALRTVQHPKRVLKLLAHIWKTVQLCASLMQTFTLHNIHVWTHKLKLAHWTMEDILNFHCLLILTASHCRAEHSNSILTLRWRCVRSSKRWLQRHSAFDHRSCPDAAGGSAIEKFWCLVASCLFPVPDTHY